jgi:hypothetical protein
LTVSLDAATTAAFDAIQATDRLGGTDAVRAALPLFIRMRRLTAAPNRLFRTTDPNWQPPPGVVELEFMWPTFAYPTYPTEIPERPESPAERSDATAGGITPAPRRSSRRRPPDPDPDELTPWVNPDAVYVLDEH